MLLQQTGRPRSSVWGGWFFWSHASWQQSRVWRAFTCWLYPPHFPSGILTCLQVLVSGAGYVLYHWWNGPHCLDCCAWHLWLDKSCGPPWTQLHPVLELIYILLYALDNFWFQDRGSLNKPTNKKGIFTSKMSQVRTSGIAGSKGWTRVIRTWPFFLDSSLRQPQFSNKMPSRGCKMVTEWMNEHTLDNNLGSLNLYFSVDKVNYLQITIEFIKKKIFFN